MFWHWLPWAGLALAALSLRQNRDTLKPNFSGNWKLNLSASKLEIPPPTSSRFEIDHREPRIRLTRTHVWGDRTDTITVEFTTDGTKTQQVLGESRVRIRAHWEGSVLVAEMAVRTKDDQGTNVVRYSLDDARNRLVAVERWRSKKMRYDNTWVLDRE